MKIRHLFYLILLHIMIQNYKSQYNSNKIAYDILQCPRDDTIILETQMGGDNEQKKDKIIDFIEENIEDIYERIDDYNKEHGFKNYEYFMNHNKNCVKKLNNEDTDFILTI